MSIDTSGPYWTGSEPADIEAYLAALMGEATPVDAFRLARCPDCGGGQFQLDTLGSRLGARHVCLGCGRSAYVGDINDYRWEGPAHRFLCVACGGQAANVGVAFTFTPTRQDIRWITVGARCARCGLLSAPADWSVEYTGTMHLLEHA